MKTGKAEFSQKTAFLKAIYKLFSERKIRENCINAGIS